MGFYPVPSFAKIKRRKVLKAFQQYTERQISQAKPNNRLAPAQVKYAPIISVTPPTEISVTPPTEIDVLIEEDVLVEERKVTPPTRAQQRRLVDHVGETEYPVTDEEREEYCRSKWLATIGAEEDQDRKKQKKK